MKTRGILKHIFAVSSLTALSRVLGLVREMLQSRIIGAGMAQSAFTFAFAIPNMTRKIFGEGALTAAFVPVFKGELERGELESARRLARAVMTCLLMILVSVSVLSVIGISVYLGWSPTLSERWVLTLSMIRTLIPYMIFICGAAFGMGVLNALGRFAEGAFMPAMLNIVWISALGILCFFPGWTLETRVKFVAWSILAGGALQMTFLFRCMAKRGFSPIPTLVDAFGVKARVVWRNTLIAVIGAGAIHINYMLDQVLAQYASEWAAGVIGYAERLMDLPLGVIGVAFGTVLLPTFSGCFARKDVESAREAFLSSIGNMLLVMIPSAIGLFALAPVIVSVIYEGGSFGPDDTLRVARALSAYSVGLCFFGIQKSIVPWFHAQGDMKTPLKVSVCTVFLNATLNVLSVWLLPVEWRHVGLAVSTAFCAAISCVPLIIFARQKNGPFGFSALWPRIAKMVLAGVVMYIVIRFAEPRLAFLGELLSLIILVLLSTIVYFPLAGFSELKARLCARRIKRRP